MVRVTRVVCDMDKGITGEFGNASAHEMLAANLSIQRITRTDRERATDRVLHERRQGDLNSDNLKPLAVPRALQGIDVLILVRRI